MTEVNRPTLVWVLVILALLLASIVAWQHLAGVLRTPAPVEGPRYGAPGPGRASRAPDLAEDPAAAPKTASPTPPDERRPFTVKVQRSNRTPAAGATVTVVSQSDEGDFDVEVARMRADANGVAAFRLLDHLVRVCAWLGDEAHATPDLVQIADTSEVSVRLAPATTVRGRVLLGDAPAARTTVHLDVQPWYGGTCGLAFRGVTDAEGRFEFPPIATDGIDPLNPAAVWVRTPEMAYGWSEAVQGGDTIVRLSPGFTVRARLLDDAGKPVPGALYGVASTTWSANSGADGRVELRLPRGATRIVAMRRTSRTTVSALSPRPILETWRTAKFLGEASGDADLGDVVFAEGKPLRGRVLDSAGRPCGRAIVTLHLGDVRVGSVVTWSDGRFEFPEVGEEAHRLHAREPEPGIGAATARQATVAEVRGGDPDVQVVLTDDFAVRLEFLDAQDRTVHVQAQQVRVRANRHGEEARCVDVATSGEPMTSFAFLLPGAGSYDLVVDVGGFEPQRFSALEAAAGRPIALDLLLRRKQD